MKAIDLRPGMTVVLDDRPFSLSAVDVEPGPYKHGVDVHTECGCWFVLDPDRDVETAETVEREGL